MRSQSLCVAFAIPAQQSGLELGSNTLNPGRGNPALFRESTKFNHFVRRLYGERRIVPIQVFLVETPSWRDGVDSSSVCVDGVVALARPGPSAYRPQ